MLSYRQLLAKLPYKNKFKERVNKVSSSITRAEIVKRGEKQGVKFSALGKAATEKVWYRVEVEMYPREKGFDQQKEMEIYQDLDQNTKCWVHCNCPFFTFHSEVVLANLGSSEVRESNGKPPHITNPSMTPYTCKHLHSVMPKALGALKKISKP